MVSSRVTVDQPMSCLWFLIRLLFSLKGSFRLITCTWASFKNALWNICPGFSWCLCLLWKPIGATFLEEKYF